MLVGAGESRVCRWESEQTCVCESCVFTRVHGHSCGHQVHEFTPVCPCVPCVVYLDSCVCLHVSVCIGACLVCV